MVSAPSQFSITCKDVSAVGQKGSISESAKIMHPDCNKPYRGAHTGRDGLQSDIPIGEIETEANGMDKLATDPVTHIIIVITGAHSFER